jgi:hypothetical protein
MAKRSILLVCMVMALGVVSVPAVLADTIIPASVSCRTDVENPDTNRSDSSKLSVRSDAKSAKSWIKFDLGDLDVSTLKTATLTVTLIEDKATDRNFDVSYVNDDCLDNIGWEERTITWNNAPGNNTTDFRGLDPSKTTLITTVDFTGGVAGQAFTIDVLEALQTDTDGIVQFVLHNANVLMNFATHDHTTEAWRPFITVTLGSGGQARKPDPADGATDVYFKPVLSWTSGKFAATHDVYLGTGFEDVNNADGANPLGVLVSQGQTESTYTPAQLDFGQTYYWRIDEVNAAPNSTIYKGEIWSFAVEPLATPITNVTATASSSMPGTDPTATADGSGLTDDLHGIASATMWGTSASATGPAWIQYDFDQPYKLHEMWVWDYNSEFEYVLGFGMKDVTVEYSIDGTTWQTLGDYVFAQAPGTAGYAHNTTVSFGGVVAKSVKLTATSNYGGTSYGLSEVRFLSIPVMARQPQPSDGATGVEVDATLTWWAGREAVSHDVYVGTDVDALSPAGTVTSPSYSEPWNVGTTYYWRVDEVNSAAMFPMWTGTVWSFTTVDYLVFDDMESYDDSDHRVYDTWVDGYGTTTNGSQVGYGESANGTFNETSTVHGGRQSMPFSYSNSGTTTSSEATRTFDTSESNWTRNGVQTLTLYFYGQASNTTTVPFWVSLTDQNNKTAKVTYGEGPGENVAAIAQATWTQWNIPLSSFTGLTLSQVKSMTIGFGSGTGEGLVFIDDIELRGAN